jgi:hypothetical protein
MGSSQILNMVYAPTPNAPNLIRIRISFGNFGQTIPVLLSVRTPATDVHVYVHVLATVLVLVFVRRRLRCSGCSSYLLGRFNKFRSSSVTPFCKLPS